MSRQAIQFRIITLGLSVLCAAASPVIGSAALFLTMLTPTLDTVVMLAFVKPEGGFRAAIAGLGLTRAGWRAMPLAVLAPLVILFGGMLVLTAGGLAAPIPPGPVAEQAAKLAVSFAAGLVVTTVLALGEETGWRGYLLPRIGGGPVRAMLLVGFVHGLWHMPLLLGTDLYHAGGNPWLVAPMVLVALTLAGVFYGFLRIRSGSVWPVAVAHAAVNAGWVLTSRLWDEDTPAMAEYLGGESGLLTICGLVVLDVLIVRALRRSGTAVQNS